MFINKNLIHNKNERGEEMNYRTIDMGSYQLHFIQTDRFKTITVRVCLRDNIVKEEITLRNFLTTFLTYSTDTYRTKRELVLKAQDLYAVNAYTKSYRAGRFNMISFYLSMLNEKYTEKGMLSKSLDFLADIIFHPNFYDEEKFQEAFQFLYQSMETSILGLKENPTLYSAVRMLEEMDPDMPYAYHEHGYLKDLEKIDKKSLEEYYHKIISSSLVDIYVIGSFDEEEMLNLLKEKMAFETFKRPKVSQLILQEKLPRRSKVRKEEIDGNQSKLSIGCKIGELTEFERNYVLSIYNMILGSGSESKFFRIIREKHSMAYYVYSSLNKLDSLMLIRAGISKSNFEHVVKLIKKEMKEMEEGIFKDEDIVIAKNNYLTLLKEIEDNENAIIETYLAKDLLNLGDIEERKQMIEKVTKEDIVKVAKKVKIDTIFLLEGNKEDEGN